MNRFKLLVLVNLIGLLVYINWSVAGKETLLKSGKTILLELAPVDPRSLMQGDYMQLDYAASRVDTRISIPRKGYAVFVVDKNGVGKRMRFQGGEAPLNTGEILLRYRDYSGWSVRLGAESYFFEEGQAPRFEKAKYGGLKVDEKGNSVLIGLFDENRRWIKPGPVVNK